MANELAYQVAEEMWFARGQEGNGEIYNMGQSNYEAGCRALNLVGIYKQGINHTLYEIIVSVDDVQAHMAGLDAVSRTALDALLSAFVENYITYGSGLSGTRSRFRVPKNLEKSLNLLVSCGYAEKLGGGFRWTDKIAPIMRRWHIWDEDGNSREDQINSHEIAVVDRLDTTMPASVRRKLRHAMLFNDPSKVYDVLKVHLHGETWWELPMQRPHANNAGRVGSPPKIIEALLRRIADSL